MPQRGRHVRLSDESPAKVVVSGYLTAQYLERFAARQPWVLGKVDFAHSPAPSKRTIVYPAKMSPTFNPIPGP
ncbi:hypothetical protein BZL30_6632 [Mycobacterium kansasii]|uniref:Uncharacterized protein n=1 Tax=Mycobacterium kansasii TaxID=1768 RepID=A0A1V3WUT8_MYCKA|nr:hypothetical protein BZL30_6632 [Mycobacterium kansasii]